VISVTIHYDYYHSHWQVIINACMVIYIYIFTHTYIYIYIYLFLPAPPPALGARKTTGNNLPVAATGRATHEGKQQTPATMI